MSVGGGRDVARSVCVGPDGGFDWCGPCGCLVKGL